MPKYESKCPQHTELDIYNGCSFNCIYCISNAEKKEFGFNLQQELEKIESIQGPVSPYYLSPWTDAYQDIEGKEEHTKQVIEALSAKNQPFFVITKSTLVKRDKEYFKNKENAFIAISLNTINNEITKVFEPNAPFASERMQLIEELVGDGTIKVVVKIDPIIPGITDKQELDKLLEWLALVRPTAVTAETLRLSQKIVDEFYKYMDNILIDSILQFYPQLNNQPVHPQINYRMKVLSKVAEILKRAGVKTSFCQASLPVKITEFDCRGGYNYDY
jgi:DNA repair photolyase